MNKNWHILPTPAEEEAISLSEKLRISKSLARLLIQRGINSYEAAEAFFRLSLKNLHDPFLMSELNDYLRLTMKVIC